MGEEFKVRQVEIDKVSYRVLARVDDSDILIVEVDDRDALGNIAWQPVEDDDVEVEVLRQTVWELLVNA